METRFFRWLNNAIRPSRPIAVNGVLQEEGAIPPTEPERLSAFNRLLAHIYQGDVCLTPFESDLEGLPISPYR
jgi:hypothetical protein